MENHQLLVSVGFTATEAKVFLALQELGESKTGSLCNKLDMPTSHIYRILDSLIQKGLVSYKLKNNVKIFFASSPDSLNILYEEKQKELENQQTKVQKVIENLKNKPKTKETASDYKYFEGLQGIKSMWIEITDNLTKEGPNEIYASTKESIRSLNAFYLDYHHKERVKKKIKERIILPENAKELISQRKKIGKIEVRTAKLVNEAEFAVFGDYLVLQYTVKKETKPRGFLIKDPVFAHTFHLIFENLWQQAKE